MTPVVLILESAPELRGMLEDGLRQHGYAVRVASDPEEALGLMHRVKVDLVLADPPDTQGHAGNGMLDEIHNEIIRFEKVGGFTARASHDGVKTGD